MQFRDYAAALANDGVIDRMEARQLLNQPGADIVADHAGRQ